jgi:D-alanyl-lipoteichoic acid acyltransferase DltB (MBOAT superfamily)
LTFTSIPFLLFLAVVLVVYWLRRERRWQNATLLAASYVFYGWVYPWHVLVLAGSTVVDFALARRMRADRPGAGRLLALSVVLNLGLLALVKYYFAVNVPLAGVLGSVGMSGDFLLSKIILPLGISFYALKKLAYMIDVRRGALEPSTSLLDFAAFVSFFPQVIAGPIDRAQKLLPQLAVVRDWTAGAFHSAWPCS